MNSRPKPVLLIVSAPSGTGKTTLCNRLRDWGNGSVAYSVSWTTRAPRASERNGVHYRFVEETEFEREKESGGFLEHALVHGHWYGTPRSAVEESLRAGTDILMDIDVQGAAQIRETLGRAPTGDFMRNAFADVFILPPSLEELRRRLGSRGQDTAEVIERRIRQADAEIKRAGEYRYGVVNDQLDTAFEALRSILIAERYRNR